MPQVLKDPFTPPAAYDALVAILAGRNLYACHRCGHVVEWCGEVPVDQPAGDGPETLNGYRGGVCGSCGVPSPLRRGSGVTREYTRAELDWVHSLPVDAEFRAEHDNVVAKLWG
jgi:hypothetical protein